jgi:hypothetical protein
LAVLRPTQATDERVHRRGPRRRCVRRARGGAGNRSRLLRKKPVDTISGSTSAGSAAATRRPGIANSVGVTMFTRVGGLRRQDRGDQQLEGRAVVSSVSAPGCWDSEPIEDLACLAGGRGSATRRLSGRGRAGRAADVAELFLQRGDQVRQHLNGTTTRARTGARTTVSVPGDDAFSDRISSSESGSTSQNVSVQSNGVCEIAQKFAYVRSPRPPSSGTMVKLICFSSAIWAV